MNVGSTAQGLICPHLFLYPITHLCFQVDFTSPGDKLLGGGICDKSALFFSNVHGVVTIRDMAAAAGAGHSVMADESRLMDSQTSMMSPEQSYMEEELSCTVSDGTSFQILFFHICLFFFHKMRQNRQYTIL